LRRRRRSAGAKQGGNEAGSGIFKEGADNPMGVVRWWVKSASQSKKQGAGTSARSAALFTFRTRA